MKKYHMVRMDEHAHMILEWAKEQVRKKGIATPSHSDAVRYLCPKKATWGDVGSICPEKVLKAIIT